MYKLKYGVMYVASKALEYFHDEVILGILPFQSSQCLRTPSVMKWATSLRGMENSLLNSPVVVL